MIDDTLQTVGGEVVMLITDLFKSQPKPTLVKGGNSLKADEE